MKTLIEHLSQYAAYHQDRRNVATHFVGIPTIVVALAILLSRPQFELAGVFVSPIIFIAILSGLFYLRLDLVLGTVMSLLLFVAVQIGERVASASTVVWLVSGVTLFVIGWVFQFVGHYYEGRKPAFVDDVVGLIIGPLFVLVEGLFLLGINKELERQMQAVCLQNNADRKVDSL